MNYDELTKAIEKYEYHLNGLKHTTVGHVDVEITHIDMPDDKEPTDDIEIHAEVTIHTEDKTETFHNVTYCLEEIMQDIMIASCLQDIEIATKKKKSVKPKSKKPKRKIR